MKRTYHEQRPSEGSGGAGPNAKAWPTLDASSSGGPSKQSVKIESERERGVQAGEQRPVSRQSGGGRLSQAGRGLSQAFGVSAATTI